jgi:hypothetical protein
MRVLLTIGTTSVLAAGPALGAGLEIKVEIPKLEVSEYHRPYVAMWIERPDRTVAANLSVWYDSANKKEKGEKWLKDLRQWWRRSGRELNMPVDGLSGATRPVGTHEVKFEADHPALAALQPGEYELIVEAAREVGGRELVRIPFKWPVAKDETGSVAGSEELGAVSVVVKP